MSFDSTGNSPFDIVLHGTVEDVAINCTDNAADVLSQLVSCSR